MDIFVPEIDGLRMMMITAMVERVVREKRKDGSGGARGGGWAV